jgi:limonene-1,2-epoxide hydrolase
LGKTIEPKLVVRAFLDAVESRDASAVAACFAQDGVYQNVPHAAFNGRIAVFPESLLAALGGLRPFAFFEAKGLEREAVKVDFAR